MFWNSFLLISTCWNLEGETAGEGASAEFPLPGLVAVAAEARQVALQLRLDHRLESEHLLRGRVQICTGFVIFYGWVVFFENKMVCWLNQELFTYYAPPSKFLYFSSFNPSPVRLCIPAPGTPVRSFWNQTQLEPENLAFTAHSVPVGFELSDKFEFSFVCWASQQRKLGGGRQSSGESCNDIWWSTAATKPLLRGGGGGGGWSVSRQKPGPQGCWSQGHSVITPTPTAHLYLG